ncbi:YciI-like protein [soil metagenome]
MLFALICNDKPNSLELRMTTRPEHVAYLTGLGGSLKAAGPFTDDNGSPIGSLVIIEADNRDSAERIAGEDPYARAGLFAATEIRGWVWSLKNPEAR